MKKVIVISLGGSLIVPNKIDVEFLKEFRRVILKHTDKYKFVIVCGGGSVARTYISGLENQKVSKKLYLQNLLGISITRINARFMSYFFGKDVDDGIPHELKAVRSLVVKSDVVFCGALRYEKNQTSDSTSARLARFFNCDFINLTNVSGLYDKNPKKFRTARFVHEVSHKAFLKMTRKLVFHPGQHFVLDQTAAKIISKYKIKTFILGPKLRNLDNLLNGRHFVGTIIG